MQQNCHYYWETVEWDNYSCCKLVVNAKDIKAHGKTCLTWNFGTKSLSLPFHHIILFPYSTYTFHAYRTAVAVPAFKLCILQGSCLSTNKTHMQDT
jgi:hypothetical protein